MAVILTSYPGINHLNWPELDEEQLSALLANKDRAQALLPSGRIFSALTTSPDK